MLLFLVTLVKGGDVGDSDLRAWFRRVNDVSSTCDDFGDLSDSEVAEEPLFTVVDCQQNGARWDYKYQVMLAVECNFDDTRSLIFFYYKFTTSIKHLLYFNV